MILLFCFVSYVVVQNEIKMKAARFQVRENGIIKKISLFLTMACISGVSVPEAQDYSNDCD